jgi:hypothetical protein
MGLWYRAGSPSGEFASRRSGGARSAQRFQTSETEVDPSAFSKPGAGRLSRV